MMADYIDRQDVPDTNVGDMISRQAALDALAELARERFTIQDYFQIYLDALKDADIKIRQLPSAQPWIIRCKECKWYQKGTHLSPNKFCYRLKDNSGKRIGYNFADDDFCSYAERRTDE